MAGLVILLLCLGIILCSSAGLGVDSRDPSFSLWPPRRTDLADVTDTQTGTARRHRSPASSGQRLPSIQCEARWLDHSDEVCNDQPARRILPAAYGAWVSTLAIRCGHRLLPR